MISVVEGIGLFTISVVAGAIWTRNVEDTVWLVRMRRETDEAERLINRSRRYIDKMKEIDEELKNGNVCNSAELDRKFRFCGKQGLKCLTQANIHLENSEKIHKEHFESH